MESLEEPKKKYQMLYDYFASQHDSYFDEEELEHIVQIAVKNDDWNENIGISHERTEWNEREKAFSDQWIEENEPKPHINHGYGILQDLFFVNKKNQKGESCHVVINKRDRMIVATIIQWLGSNIGMCFLNESLKKFNCQVAPIKHNLKK